MRRINRPIKYRPEELTTTLQGMKLLQRNMQNEAVDSQVRNPKELLPGRSMDDRIIPSRKQLRVGDDTVARILRQPIPQGILAPGPKMRDMNPPMNRSTPTGDRLTAKKDRLRRKK
jgi:hypothetical protein